MAYDLRGHGMSQAPLEPEHYTDTKLWADDVAAIIQQLGLERPVLVGWSYGGYIICDYLRAHGQDRIGAITWSGGHQVGPGSLRHADRPRLPGPFRRLHRRRPADQHPRHARPGRGLRGDAAAGDDIETAAVLAMRVPARDPRQPRRPRDRRRRRAAQAAGAAAGQPGPADTVVLPAMAEHILAHLPDRRASWYEGVGHTPSWRHPSASTANWPRWPAASVLEPAQ